MQIRQYSKVDETLLFDLLIEEGDEWSCYPGLDNEALNADAIVNVRYASAPSFHTLPSNFRSFLNSTLLLKNHTLPPNFLYSNFHASLLSIHSPYLSSLHCVLGLVKTQGWG